MRKKGTRVPAGAVSDALRRLAEPQRVEILQSFFKTGPGQYAAGDRFIGVKVPEIRRVVRQFRAMTPGAAEELVRSPIHEERLAGLLLWVSIFEAGDDQVRRSVFDLYLRNTRCINNWDLVDASAPPIVGGFLDPTDTTVLESLAASASLWERRIAVMATFRYIRQGMFAPTLSLCRHLLTDKHELMHKACGWMLREVGKRDRPTLDRFLDRHAAGMPRTMLRYALERHRPADRHKYMAHSPLRRDA